MSVVNRNALPSLELRHGRPHVGSLGVNLDGHLVAKSCHRARDLTAFDLAQRVCPAESLNVPGDDGIRLRKRGEIDLLAVLFKMGGPRLGFPGFSNRRHSRRMRGAVVAGVACHHLVPVEIGLIDGEHHAHHFARPPLRLLSVLVKVVLNMAEVAMHSKRGRDELHGRDQLVCRNVLENFDVLIDLRRRPG